MGTAVTDTRVARGLEGVVVADTAVGGVDGRAGFYHYREHSATELARTRSFEDVVHLLLSGALPVTQAQSRNAAAALGRQRVVPPATAVLLPGVAATAATPLDGLRTAVSLVAAEEGFAPTLDLGTEELRAQAARLVAVLPTLAAALHRLSAGLDPVPADPGRAHAADYLRMLTGTDPDPAAVRAVEQYLVATIDHGLNASTFTARVITSTGADLGAAIVGAIGALSGPLHGGAPSRALELLAEIGSPERAEEVVRAKLAAGQRIMGFGHRVYKTRDPRSVLLREAAQALGGRDAELAAAVEDVVVRVLADVKPGRELYANVEYFAGVVLAGAGVPASLFTPTFAASRVVGWCAHALEQAADNRIIRPSSAYVGPPAPQPVPALREA